MGILAEREARLLDGGAIIPIYHYSSTELIKPYVKGIYPTALDTHPLTPRLDRSRLGARRVTSGRRSR
jgi:hypothetical protein